MEHAHRMDVRMIELSALEFAVSCLHEEVTAARIVSVQFTPRGKIQLSTTPLTGGRTGRKRITVNYEQPAYITSVVAVRNLRFVEMTPVAAELEPAVLVADILGRLRPSYAGRPCKDVFCPASTTEVASEQYLFDANAERFRFTRLSLPDGVSVRSVRFVEECDLLLAIITDQHRGRSFIGALPVGELRIDQLNKPSLWRIVGRSYGGAEMVWLSRPRVSLASMGAARIVVVVGNRDGSEAVLSLTKEVDGFRETWDGPHPRTTQTLGLLSGTTDRTVTWTHTGTSVDIEIRDADLSDPIIRAFARE